MVEPVREIDAADLASPEQFQREVAGPCEPLVIRGLVADWPVVAAGRRGGPAGLRDYLLPLAAPGKLEAFFGEPDIRGRYYYGDGLSGFNFERRPMAFAEALEAMVRALDAPDSATIYLGSAPTEACLPRFAALNPMPLTPANVGPRIWLGHASNVASHYDALDNLACAVIGRRRFTLYAPELIGRLYVGPIDHTMAGQPVSLAASSAPDESRFPLFAEVRDQARVAELEAGDALYLPKLWWHQVEATAPLNGLVNYWWDAFPQGPDAPYTSLLLAMIAIGERPARERRAWQAFFEHYVFRPGGHPLRHLPPEKHGLLGPLRPENYGRIRAWVMHLLRGGA